MFFLTQFYISTNYILTFKQKHTSWDDFFDSFPDYRLNYQHLDNTPQYAVTNGTGIHVYNCKFTEMAEKAIYVYINTAKFLCERSSFFNCISEWDGGAIGGNLDESVLNSVCCASCHVKEDRDCQFCTISIETENANKKNYIMASSIFDCKNTNANTYHIIYMRKGLIKVESTNVSNNECEVDSGIGMVPSPASWSTGIIEYSSFKKNTALNRIVLSFEKDTALYEIMHSNILENCGESTVKSKGVSTINNCCFIGNEANTIFDSDSQMIVNGSSLGPDQQKGSSFVSFVNSPPRQFINGLYFLDYDLCKATFDIYNGYEVIEGPELPEFPLKTADERNNGINYLISVVSIWIGCCAGSDKQV